MIYFNMPNKIIFVHMLLIRNINNFVFQIIYIFILIFELILLFLNLLLEIFSIKFKIKMISIFIHNEKKK